MCNTRSIIDPGGLLYGKHGKFVDPLGVTKTALGGSAAAPGGRLLGG